MANQVKQEWQTKYNEMEAKWTEKCFTGEMQIQHLTEQLALAENAKAVELKELKTSIYNKVKVQFETGNLEYNKLKDVNASLVSEMEKLKISVTSLNQEIITSKSMTSELLVKQKQMYLSNVHFMKEIFDLCSSIKTTLDPNTGVVLPENVLSSLTLFFGKAENLSLVGDLDMTTQLVAIYDHLKTFLQFTSISLRTQYETVKNTSTALLGSTSILQSNITKYQDTVKQLETQITELKQSEMGLVKRNEELSIQNGVVENQYNVLKSENSSQLLLISKFIIEKNNLQVEVNNKVKELAESNERNVQLRQMNDEVMAMLEKMYEEK